MPGDSVGVISVSTAHLSSPLWPSDDLSNLILAPCPDSDQTRPGPGGPVQLSRSARVSQQVSETRDGNITTILSFLSRPTSKLSSIFISNIFCCFLFDLRKQLHQVKSICFILSNIAPSHPSHVLCAISLKFRQFCKLNIEKACKMFFYRLDPVNYLVRNCLTLFWLEIKIWFPLRTNFLSTIWKVWDWFSSLNICSISCISSLWNEKLSSLADKIFYLDWKYWWLACQPWECYFCETCLTITVDNHFIIILYLKLVLCVRWLDGAV